MCYSKRRSLQPKGAVWFHGSKSDTAPWERVYSQWPADPRGWTRAPSEWPCSRTSAGPVTAHDLGSSRPEPAFGPGCQTETGKHTKEVSTTLCKHHHPIYSLSYTSIWKWFLVFLQGWPLVNYQELENNHYVKVYKAICRMPVFTGKLWCVTTVSKWLSLIRFWLKKALYLFKDINASVFRMCRYLCLTGLKLTIR